MLKLSRFYEFVGLFVTITVGGMAIMTLGLVIFTSGHPFMAIVWDLAVGFAWVVFCFRS